MNYPAVQYCYLYWVIVCYILNSVWIQISWQKPADLDLLCFQKKF